jgi:protein arginine kinase activator
MLRQSCGKNPAAVHIKTIENGEPAEYSICAECARKLGYGDLLAGLGYSLEGVWNQPFEEENEEYGAARCKCCGASFGDIARSGKVGCAQCYRTFSDRLAPVVRRIHGSVAHRGKVPGSGLSRPKPKGKLSVMHEKLREAINSEDFEQAAVLRDHIKMLEKGGGDEDE